jgi:hypothetical protein
MAAGFQANFIGLTDASSVPAAGTVSPNMRAKTTLGAIATLADVVSFPGVPSVVGNWVMPAMRCFAGSIPVINASSSGIAYSPLGVPTGPMKMISPDTKATGG